MTNYEVFNKQFHPSWIEHLKPILSSSKMDKTIKEIALSSSNSKLPIYPKTENVFRVFNEPFEKIKVLLQAQDPYHTPDVAHGLAFSSNKPKYLPPSLDNIFKELSNDIKEVNKNVNLERWSKQGVFLLNTSLTVLKGNPGIHLNHWKWFTDEVIKILNYHKSNLVVMLWGANAKKTKSLFDEEEHLILEAAHPSPFSAHRGFLGCKHFSKCNNYLIENGIEPIDWNKN